MEDTLSLTMSVNDESAQSDESLKHLSRSISLRSYNKWSPTEHGVTLAWRDVSIYAAKSAKKIKRIINNSTGALTSGSLVALMGTSGSGKTTLMSALAYRNQSKWRTFARS
jgi:ABC-type glutathione transport system ATPase component